MNRFFAIAAGLLAACPALAAGDAHDHDHDHDHAHEHGKAALTVIVVDDTLTVRLEMTGGDLWGEPGDGDHDDPAETAGRDHDHDDHDDHAHDDEHADDAHMLEKAEALLRHADDFVTFTPAAGCAAAEGRATVSEIEGGDHDGHRDVTLTWSFACDAPEALTGLTVTALDRGTGLEHVSVDVINGADSVAADAGHGSENVTWGGTDG